MKKLVYLILLISLQNCSQKKEVTMITQNPHITANNIVEEINKEVKHYPVEKVYIFAYESLDCHFEIFVNDVPCYKDFSEPGSSSGFDINQCIFKSGTQKLTFRMYPADPDNPTIEKFTEDAYLSFQLESYNNKNKGAEDAVYQKFKTPVTTSKDQYGNIIEKFIANGKTYYEGSFTFEATVPYQLQGFDKMQDLRKMDKKVLEQKLLAKYQEIWQMYNNKQYDDIARIFYNKLKDEYISSYETNEGVKENWASFINTFKNDTFEMQPLKDYKLEFFADGKCVALMQTSLDKRNRGSSALWAKFKEDGKVRAAMFKNYFYIPEGETEFKVY
ncbi:hypothetical protein FLACOL_01261 [Flavobacterium columnare]|uniref:SnoaL-like domain-containing protein n=2 Tax=Flavobacterium TaxID=237 RepID=A0ABW8PLH3_9FLAO|nr:hypothetical protein [Flavobacterium columnare]SPE77268.1 hypothetical protein FLACOL_01261 [Flavobacterium columnare]